MPLTEHADALEELYRRYNRKQFVHPDPLEFLFDYQDPRDREVVGLVASSLAYGRVGQILRSVSWVLHRMGPSPARFVRDASAPALRRKFRDFKHRFNTGDDLAALLYGAKRTIARHGSLEACFAAAMGKDDETVLPALSGFVGELMTGANGSCNHLLPDPARRSACKRLNLYLRWLVRCDQVDPGGWRCVPPSRLLVPLDTHMHKIARAFGLTHRKAANMRTALEITSAFRGIAPDDPVRYDFALTRLGIHPDADMQAFLAKCNVGGL